MSVIIILIIVSVLVALLFLIGFIWAVINGQYDDPYSSSVRILFDDKKRQDNKNAENKTPEQKNSSGNKSV